MKLRKLKLQDASKMLEWMHDRNVVQDLRTDFMSKTIEDCEQFINNSWEGANNQNFAITDENDVYMGTVSLKNINEKSAEFGITVRSCAMGRGYAKEAMHAVLKIAFEELKLERVYWCVSPDNKRAIRFYDKNDFQRISSEMLGEIEGYTKKEIATFFWYLQKRSDFFKN